MKCSLPSERLRTSLYPKDTEDHEENVDVQMGTNIPVFAEVKEREISVAPDEGYNFILEGDNLHSLYLLEKTHKGKIDVIYIDMIVRTLIQSRGIIEKCAFAVYAAAWGVK